MNERQWALLWLVIVSLLLQSLYLTQRVERLEHKLEYYQKMEDNLLK